MKVAGQIRVPGDKSISHRAVMFAGLARGRSRLTGVLDSEDVRSTAGVMRALGATVPDVGPEMVVEGRGTEGLHQPKGDLDCGNSGTTTRLVAGIVAGRPIEARFVGDASLSGRPMKRIAEPLSAMGAQFQFERGDGLPMRIRGAQLHSIAWDNPKSSAQVKTAILLAGLVGQTSVSVWEPIRSRDHTERLFKALGVPLENENGRVTLVRSVPLQGFELAVPGDPSSAAFIAGLAAVAASGSIALPDVCLNETRTGFFRALERMGAAIRTENVREVGGEPVGTIIVTPRDLRAISIEPAEIPSLVDEIPLLACLGARAIGETRVSGAGELRVKESDRIAAVVRNLKAIGVQASEEPDGLRVRGTSAPLGGRVETYGDHRIAMAFGVLAAIPGNDVVMDDRACVAVSYPAFWDDLKKAVG